MIPALVSSVFLATTVASFPTAPAVGDLIEAHVRRCLGATPGFGFSFRDCPRSRRSP